MNETNKPKMVIEQVFVYVQKDENGDEGIIGIQVPSLTHPGQNEWLPLVGADTARVQSLNPIAQEIANHTGVPVSLLYFSTRQEVAVLQPSTPKVAKADHKTSEGQS